MKKVWNLSILLFLYILYGCSGSMSLVEFEVLEPASILLPENARQLLIMNRLPLTHNFLDSSEVSRLSLVQLQRVDTIITKNVFLGLDNVMKKSPIETFHFPTWHVERQSDLFASNDVKLTKKEVKDLCFEHYSDAIVSLESCKLKIKNDGYVNTDYLSFSTVYQSVLTTGWVLYLPMNPRPYRETSLTDTMYYVNKGRDPLLSELIRDHAFHNGSIYGRMLTPVWKKAVRNIYSRGNFDLRRASRHTDKGEWEKAFSQWAQLADSGDSTDMTKALYNMSVYSELEDRLDSASFYINLAVASDTLSPVRKYKEEIDQRIRHRRAILEQVERARLDRRQ